MIDFPAAPVAGQIFFASNGGVYQYSSTYTAWVQIASTVPQDASVCASSLVPGMAAGTTVVVSNYTTMTGNAGGWLNTANGRFTPPAGRYFLKGMVTLHSAASLIIGQTTLRKNGVLIPGTLFISTSPAVNNSTEVSTAAIVDANGTDYFELTAYGHVLAAATNALFAAFPLSQQTMAGGSSWRQIAHTEVVAPQAHIDFQNIPSDINNIEVRYDCSPVTNGVSFLTQLYDGGGTLLTAGYQWSSLATANTVAVGAAPSTSNNTSSGIVNSVCLSYSGGGANILNTVGIRGIVRINNIRDAARGKSVLSEAHYVNEGATAMYSITGAGRHTSVHAVSGLRFLCGSGNIAAGSVATLYGSP
jgi:hypothetical protein